LVAAIHRLHRLVETSRNYLMVQQPGQLVKVTWKPIRNLYDYFEDLIVDYPELLVTHPEDAAQDKSFTTDEYWLNVCLKNLINNAHYHGKLPVTLSYRVLGQQQRWLEIQIYDRGECEFTHLSDMTQEFRKGTSSQGSGLGLHITMQILTCINGELYFSSKPTTFTMRLKERYE
jgi:signal transduction histidine kinase